MEDDDKEILSFNAPEPKKEEETPQLVDEDEKYLKKKR